MRPSFTVLAAAAIFAASCNAASAVDQAQVVSENLALQAAGALSNNGNAARFLRRRETTDDLGEDEIDSLDNDEEERGGKTWAQKFAKWHARGETADDVYERFALEAYVKRAYNTGLIGELKKNPYYQKWLDYGQYLRILE